MKASNCQLGAPNSVVAERTGVAFTHLATSPARHCNDHEWGVDRNPAAWPGDRLDKQPMLHGSTVGSSQHAPLLGAPNTSGAEVGR